MTDELLARTRKGLDNFDHVYADWARETIEALCAEVERLRAVPQKVASFIRKEVDETRLHGCTQDCDICLGMVSASYIIETWEGEE